MTAVSSPWLTRRLAACRSPCSQTGWPVQGGAARDSCQTARAGRGVEPASQVAGRGSDHVIVGGQRAAAEVAGRCAGRVQRAQGGHEAGQGDRRLFRVGDRGQGGDLARQPGAHHPGPRIALTGLALPGQHRDGQRQPWPYDRQPPVLAFQVVGTELAARQPDREIRPEAEDRVVEARCPGRLYRQARPLRELGRNKPADQRNVDPHLIGRP